MIGLLLMYFIGNYYYRLAQEFHKSKWGFAILGVIAYYAGTYLAGFTLGVILAIMEIEINSSDELVIGLVSFPFGILATWGLYTLLKKKWSSAPAAYDLEGFGESDGPDINAEHQVRD